MHPIFVAECRCQGRISGLALGWAVYLHLLKQLLQEKNKYGKHLWIKAKECLKYRLLKKST